MTTLRMTRTLAFDAGHRLLNHESKCAHVHGHRFVVEVTLELSPGAALDRAGRIVDFGDVKERLGGWIDRNLDHAFIANEADPIVAWLEEHEQRRHVVAFEPSAENLAAYLLEVAQGLLDVCDVRRVVSLVVHETPNGRAEATS